MADKQLEMGEELVLPSMEEALMGLSDVQFDSLLSELFKLYEKGTGPKSFAGQTPWFGHKKKFTGFTKAEEKVDQCGAGSSGGGGFEPGNTCAAGGSGGSSEAGSASGGSDAAPKQENAAAGKPAASSGAAGDKPKPERWNVEKDIPTAAKEGGFTFHPKSGKSPTTGFAVSIFPEHERILDLENVTQDEMDKYREDTRSAWEGDPRVHLGGWHNVGEDGKFYLDASKIVDTKEEAIALGKEHGQLAGYDVERGEVFQISTREERDEYQRKKTELATGQIRQEKTTPTANGANAYNPYVEADNDGDGITDASRVGIGGRDVVPPPEVPRMPNLTKEERRVEERFARTFEMYPQEMADAYIEMVKNSEKPNTFETDGAKLMSSAWNDSDDNIQAEKRGRYNVALHQTANAIAKRAFTDYVSKLPPGSEILVTVGGCGAGKGYALKQIPSVAGLSKSSAAVWDSAGDQNGTESPWIQDLAELHGHKVTYAYIHNDPYRQWADPGRGVVKRANDPADGRMVDASVFADSYAIGAKNFAAFKETHKDNPNVKFVIIDSTGKKPKQVNELPPAALQVDRKHLTQFAASTVANRGVAPRVKRGALVGARIWKENE